MATGVGSLLGSFPYNLIEELKVFSANIILL